MFKQNALATIAVFVTWTIIDILVHGNLLVETYLSTPHLWRPEAEMNSLLMFAVTAVYGFCFVALYQYFVQPKSMSKGIKFGAIFGIAVGVVAGFGSYVYMPISLHLAESWFAISLIKLTAAGAIVGSLVKGPGE
jgi:hypothetical protein|tara:strand:- start:117 stop:521 length:405 start_codon:yes stop_codon:yes gene_type:complete